jgi:ankyrin repeat protein
MRKNIYSICPAFVVLCLCFSSCDRREIPPPWELLPFYQAIENNDMDAVHDYMKKYKHIANFEINDILGAKKTNTVTSAVRSGNMEMLELMVKEKATVNLQTYPGAYTALHLAIQMKRKDMIEYLLNHNADPRITDHLGNNVFHYLALNLRNFEIAQLFLKYASDLINQKQIEGAYPLGMLIIEQYDDDQYDAPGVLELLQLGNYTLTHT